MTVLSIVLSFISNVKTLLPTGRAGTVIKAVLLLITLANVKNWPLFWHARFYSSLFLHLFRRKKHVPDPSHLFAPISTYTRSPFYECDLNLHKSNSTYFSDLDIARTHLIAHIIKKSLKKRHGTGQSTYVALAGVNCLFRREIKPFTKYEIVTRILGWDEKWLWVVSHFVKVGEDDKADTKQETPSKRTNKKIYASALSKYVFKCGRQTVKPETILQESGVLPPKPEGREGTAEGTSSPGSASSDDGTDVVKVSTAEAVMNPTGASKKELVAEHLDTTLFNGFDGDLTWERIEEERKKGVEIAQHMLGLDALDDTYIGSGSAPGGIGVF